MIINYILPFNFSIVPIFSSYILVLQYKKIIRHVLTELSFGSTRSLQTKKMAEWILKVRAILRSVLFAIGALSDVFSRMR